MSLLNRPYFFNEKAAFEHLEKVLWADGPVCPHCGGMDRVYVLEGVKGKTGKERFGLKKCGHCRKQFTVKVGTVFESAHIPLHKMLQAVYLMCSSKKGVSSHQLHRTLEITYKSAWFLAHRIREAMRDGKLGPLGGLETHVEADETFIGRLQGQPKAKAGFGHKNVVLTLVERKGKAKSFHIASTGRADVEQIVRANVSKEATLMTDEGKQYIAVGREFLDHQTVNHSQEEYVRGIVHTNTVEGFYSIFKRGMKGIYQHCSEKHLHRYLAEYDFRYSHRVALGVNDETRSGKALAGIVGKRLTYGGSRSA